MNPFLEVQERAKRRLKKIRTGVVLGRVGEESLEGNFPGDRNILYC